MAERVTILTSDRVQLVGEFGVAQGRRAALLLHMMPADRRSWIGLAGRLQGAGLATLAIDLRGHGESRRQDGRTLDYERFSDADHQRSILDVQASVAFLAERGFAAGQVGIVGASIGANLALEQLVGAPAHRAAVLLSPGLDYRGVDAGRAITKLRPHQTIFLAASREDVYAAQSVEALARRSPVRYQIKLLEGAGHGTAMFSRAPELAETIVGWLANAL